MSVEMTFEVRDSATRAIQRLVGKLAPQRLSAAVGPDVQQLVKDNFDDLGTNKRGRPSTGFYAQAKRETQWQQAADGTRVSVNKIGIRQRRYGGRIYGSNFLTIPMSREAYGHQASEFPGTFVLRTMKGAYIVQRQGSSHGSRLGARLNFLFKLEASVDQAPDPNVLPANKEIGRTARKALLGLIQN